MIKHYKIYTYVYNIFIKSFQKYKPNRKYKQGDFYFNAPEDIYLRRTILNYPDQTLTLICIDIKSIRYKREFKRKFKLSNSLMEELKVRDVLRKLNE